jgi:zinc/manganese transport system permease protein
MCLVIASIHVYLGMHILEREIIFVDLALAQLAALGASLGALISPDEHEHGGSDGLPLLPFAFTLIGALLFALTRRARRHVSQEAVVGIVYAVASAVMVLVLSRAPHGAERIKDVLVGSLLTADWSAVGRLALAYAVLGGAQALLARRFIRISWHTADSDAMPYVTYWDFGFYVLFGIVITLSVQIAGVLLVFSYLIVPAVITRLFTRRISSRLVAGWAVALVASGLGLWGSWSWDLPTGAAVVAAFGLLLGLAGALRAFVAASAAGSA